MISDYTEGALQFRSVSFYTASFSIGVSLSYLMAGEIHALAVYSTLGFGLAFLAPLTVGFVLDFFGGNRLAWGMGILCMAGGCLLGPVFLARLN